MRGRLLGGVVAVVCMTTALALSVTPAFGATTTAATTTGAAATSAAAVSTTATPTVSSPSFGLGNAGSADTTTVVTSATGATTTTSTTGTGLSGGDGILIGVVVVGLLLGIAAFVMRDARSHTANDPDVSDDPFASKRKGSKAPPKSRKLKPAERKRRKRSRAPRKRW